MLTGGIGVMQKLHQSSIYKDELGIFLVLSFTVTGLFSMSFVLKDKTVCWRERRANSKVFWIYCLISGIGVAVNNEINLYLSGVMPSIVFYPVVNGAGILLSCGAGLLFWHERLNKKQWIGLIMGAVAIGLLSC